MTGDVAVREGVMGAGAHKAPDTAHVCTWVADSQAGGLSRRE